ncbi:hypothetical protein BVRB_7g158350 [Beta vulgaris subsp. vulgaris]|nr:hypothetical protein BVRB_7g158350 [Beta vulgaris subsp. vulgaris]
MYVNEYESLFVFLRNQSSYLPSTSFGALLERIHFYPCSILGSNKVGGLGRSLDLDELGGFV